LDPAHKLTGFAAVLRTWSPNIHQNHPRTARRVGNVAAARKATQAPFPATRIRSSELWSA
jgi:hypothetical protein